MMVKLGLFIAALLASSVNAFAPVLNSRVSTVVQAKKAVVDNNGNNIAVKNLFETVDSSGLLTAVAQSKLLSNAQAAGISLSSVEPLLKAAGGNQEVMILLEAATPELLGLPILPKVIEFAPAALPLLSILIQIPTAAILFGGVASLAGAAASVVLIPDDTILEIAAQTILVATLGLVVPALSVGGSVVLSKVKN